MNLNWPNILTLSRVPIAILGYISFLHWDKQAGLLLFIIGFVTDWLDGRVARANNCSTEFGKLMDPITDKFLVLTAFLVLAQKHIVPYWVILLIALREIYFTALRISIIKKGRPVIPAGWWGKVKTTSQMIALAVGLTALTWNIQALYPVCLWISYASLALTYYSGYLIYKQTR